MRHIKGFFFNSKLAQFITCLTLMETFDNRENKCKRPKTFR